MNIIELTSEHAEAVKPLYHTTKYMGINSHSNYFVDTTSDSFEELYHKSFVETYLSGLKNYKAFGLFEDGEIKSLLALYQSNDEPCWYGTQIRSLKNKNYVPPLLDYVMRYNEQQGRLKFYTLWSKKHSRLLRRFAFTEEANERYAYVDELIVPAKTKCIYTSYWHILFNRILLPHDTVIRCTYLKAEYRTELPVGGNL